MKKLMGLMAAMVLLLAACGGNDNASDGGNGDSSGEGGEQNMTLQAWAWNINVPVLEKAAELFAEENPGFTLEINETGTPDVYQKITTGLQAGGEGLPDIMLVEDDRLQGYLNAFPEAFVNVSEKGFDEHTDKFPGYKTELLTKDGGLYGFPFDAGPAGVFYRTDLFEEAGIDAQSIETWDDFIEAGKQLKEATGVAMTGIDVNNDDGVYRLMLNQQGTFYFNDAGEVALTSDESVKAMNVIKTLVDEGLNENLVGWDAWIGGLANGTIATAPTGAWLTGSLTGQAPDMEGQWGVFPLPAMEEGGNRAANLGGSNYMIPTASDQQDLAYEFMEFFSTSEEVQLTAMEGGLFPSLNTIYDEPIFKEPVAYFSDQKIWEMFAGMMDDIPTANYTGNYALARDEATKAQSLTVNGTDPVQALQEAADRLKNRIQ
ncbi:ABC transporter substrate-binding protein [Aureibacillus halotolerans]|uniref:Carbohydrate ABC transporter substrate-binding protein (CUT1 family) n=1 Tax=Aureibacillus halotolerans TaxID=1508390 RepID=A0A4V3D5P1_9BACI|nr:sugar ABC transporter substrate-binding protein [Aureibacillus halotolerans]TDQ40837.1 carbohydrate ABC transporter substrate-binding protein (CUT1 family) [Aureibacillus halotolerans]